MAYKPYYNNNYNNQGGSLSEKELATDWTIKEIPGICYKACLTTKEKLLLIRKGVHMGDAPSQFAFPIFISALAVFYDTVEADFSKYLETDTYKNDATLPKKSSNEYFTKKDYDNLAIVNEAMTEGTFLKAMFMFEILRKWCFLKGPFKVYSEIEDDRDLFEKIQEEYA